MPSLAKVAWGLLLVYLDLRIQTIDVIPDVLGWVLVLVGLSPLTGRSTWFGTAVAAAWVGLAGSVLQLVAPTSTVLVLVEAVAETGVCVGVCTAVIALVPDASTRRRAAVIRGWTVALTVLALLLVPAAAPSGTLTPDEMAQVSGPVVVLVVAAALAGLVLVVVWIAFLFALAKPHRAASPARTA